MNEKCSYCEKEIEEEIREHWKTCKEYQEYEDELWNKVYAPKMIQERNLQTKEVILDLIRLYKTSKREPILIALFEILQEELGDKKNEG